MYSFLPSANDPIVSILLLLGIIFIVSVLSYAYTIWRQDRDNKELIEFVKNFETSRCELDTTNMPFDDSMKKPLSLLALAYLKSGEYSKSIELYSYLIKHTNDDNLLEFLALAYFKAGFLQRALDIYLKIVSKKPRNKDVLYKIEYIYEKLNDFDNAKDALDVLEALGESVQDYKLNLEYKKIMQSFMPKEEKFKKLLKLFNSLSSNKSFILRAMFKLNPKEAFLLYKDEYFENLIDILSNLKKEDVNFDIISRSNYLSMLYFIKGYIDNYSQKSNNFALNILSSSKKCGAECGELRYIYLCKKCKINYPLHFLRCPNCHSIYSMKIEVLIEEKKKVSKALQ